MKKSASLILLFSTIGFNLDTHAADYTVQVGAYKGSATQTIQQAKEHGEVFQNTGGDNLTRVTVGRFATKAQAIQKRDQLKNSGFNGAFITTIPETSNFSEVQNQAFSEALDLESTKLSSIGTTYNSSPQSIELSDLSPDELSKASYLDGQLRILSNGQFLTIEQYRRQ